MSMIDQNTVKEVRYCSNFGMLVDHAECFEALQVEDLTRDEITGERQPYVVEWFVSPGQVRDTYKVNGDTLLDVWDVKKEASIELQVVVFKSEAEKELYLESKLKK